MELGKEDEYLPEFGIFVTHTITHETHLNHLDLEDDSKILGF